MKKTLKNFTITLFIILIFNIVTFTCNSNVNVKASGGVGYSIKNTFKDPYLAKLMAENLGKAISDTLTQEDIDNFLYLNIFGRSISDLSGIEHFINLAHFTLHNSQITHLPDFFGNFTDLKYISVFTSQLQTFPESIGNLTNLETISIYQSEFSTLPESIGNLSNLKILEIYESKINSLPDSIGNLSNLTMLALHGNFLTTIPESIGNLPNIEYLNLSRNNLSSLPDSIVNLKTLNSLSVSENSIINLPNFTDMSSSFSLDAYYQRVFLQNLRWNNPVTVDNAVKGFDGLPLSPDTISNDGTISNNLITWENLDEKTQTVSYSFDTMSSDNRMVFSGKVYHDVVFGSDINDLNLEAINSQTYSGNSIVPPVKLLDGNYTLIEGTDFDAVFSNNINAGIASVTLTGKNVYYGTRDINFEITKAIPKVDYLPIASNVYLNDPVSSATLNDGVVSSPQGEVLSGTFAFKNPSLTVTQDSPFEVIFTPENPNYEPINMFVRVYLKTNVNGNILPRTGGIDSLVYISISLILCGLCINIFKKINLR